MSERTIRPADAIVAIPASNEAGLVSLCLAALAIQRAPTGRPLADAGLEVVLLANNCTDDTAAVARGLAPDLPYRLHVIETQLPRGLDHAGGARRAAMEAAADRLEASGRSDGLVLTTDADSRVGPTWLAANLAAIEAGADAVAGYVDPDPDDYLRLGPAFGRRGRVEDRYLEIVAAIEAFGDPRPHDPWPNHRVASGASLAVTLSAYRAIGGLPLRPAGEDAAFVHALECGGFRVRHSLDALVTTSCRFDGRAVGGAADTMRARHADLDAPCDDGLEGARPTLWRAGLRGRLRRLHEAGRLAETERWAGRLRIDRAEAARIADLYANRPFALLWDELLAGIPRLGPPSTALRPSHLPAEIALGERLLRRLRGSAPGLSRREPRGDRPVPGARSEPAADPSWP